MLRISLSSCRNNLTNRRFLLPAYFRNDVILSATCELYAVPVNCAARLTCSHGHDGRALLHSRGRKVSSVGWEPSTHTSLWLSRQGQIRRFSVSSVWCIDADDGIGTENKPLNTRSNQRGPRRGIRKGRRGVNQSVVSEGAGKDDSLVGAIEADVDDELIDIHDPQGKDLPQENFNEFDVQYFGDTKLSNTSFFREEIASGDPKSLVRNGDEHDVSVDTDLNEFDQEYFGGAVFDKPRRRKSQTIVNASKPWSLASDVNDIDKQYFNASVQVSDELQTKFEHNPVFLDTSSDEQRILWEQKKSDQLLMEQEIAMLQDRSQRKSKFEFQDEITAVDFQEMSNSQLPKGEKVKKPDISPSLQHELSEARKILEQTHMSQQNTHDHLAGLEPEVKETLISLKKKKKPTSEKLQEGVDISVASSSTPCSGCGAFLQCNNVEKPGFIPKSRFVSLMEKLGAGKIALTMKELCARCSNLIRQREALHVNVNQDDYVNIIKAIRKKRALVLVMVDLLDFPCSFIPNLKDVIGNKHMCLVGNKMDLLPMDSRGYDKRIKKHLLQACLEAGVCSVDNVEEIFLVSAKTGYGIEAMITKLHRNWGTQGDVYLLGTANVGKSTLFNRLLESDYCKSKASYLLGKATISHWPGTTLNLLRFPIMNLTKTRVAQRVQRLQAERKAEQDRLLEKKFSEMRGNQKEPIEQLDSTAYVKGNVGRTFDYYKTDDELGFNIGEDPFNFSIGKSSEDRKKPERSLPFDFHPNEFNDGCWFYDTPGVIHDKQVLTKLTLEELKFVVPQGIIQPKTIVMKPGETFFLAGLGRLDYLQGNSSIYFTLFTCRNLPIRVVQTEEAGAYYAQHAGHKLLGVPMGGEGRMKNFPALKPVDLNVKGIGWQESVADILFSSAGWTSVTAGTGMEIHLRAYTPAGNGCLLRQPSLLPYAIQMRGQRIKGTPFYGISRKRLARFIP